MEFYQRERDKKAMIAQPEQDIAEIREEFEIKRLQDKTDNNAQINELKNLFGLRQQSSSSSHSVTNLEMPEGSNNANFIRH